MKMNMNDVTVVTAGNVVDEHCLDDCVHCDGHAYPCQECGYCIRDCRCDYAQL